MLVRQAEEMKFSFNLNGSSIMYVKKKVQRAFVKGIKSLKVQSLIEMMKYEAMKMKNHENKFQGEGSQRMIGVNHAKCNHSIRNTIKKYPRV